MTAPLNIVPIMDAVRSFVRASRGWNVSADGDSMDVDAMTKGKKRLERQGQGGELEVLTIAAVSVNPEVRELPVTTQDASAEQAQAHSASKQLVWPMPELQREQRELQKQIW